MVETSLPIPEPSEDTQEFWEGLKRHELFIQRCAECGTLRHYPRPCCHNCASLNYEWVRASGRGTIYSYMVAHHAFHPAFRDKVPYAVALVELDDIPGVRMASNLVDCPLEQVRIGMPVEVVYEDWSPEVTVYKFRPRS